MKEKSHLTDQSEDLAKGRMVNVTVPPRTSFPKPSTLLVIQTDNVTYYLFVEEDIASIESQFTRDRGDLPCLFIATPDDPHRSRWTRGQRPSAPIAMHMIHMAIAAEKMMEKHLTNVEDAKKFKVREALFFKR